MSGLTPLNLTDFAVVAALHAGEGADIGRVARAVAAPPSGPGVRLTEDSVRRVLTRLEARGIAENASASWQLTARGRALWASKGGSYTL